MKRKTNLFNLDPNTDTTFLTFSNYAEYLTGNFLSTDTKLYPSTFICYKLPFDDMHTIDDFKMFLMTYYENKLAVVRNHYIEGNKDIEDYVEPLNYLIEAIHKYFDKDITLPEQQIPIVYINDVVEQDYKGTYTDTLCVVSLNKYFKSASQPYLTDERTDSTVAFYSEDASTETLFGWDDNDLTSLYNQDETANINVNPIFDDESGYYVQSLVKGFNFEESTEDAVEFNCIIPLFDISNIKHDTLDKEHNYLLEVESPEMKTHNIPLGMWIVPESVKIAKYNGYCQNWTLVIGSKFSPLPYGAINNIEADSANNKEDQNWLTYAQLLYKQNEIHNKFMETLNNYKEISASLNNVQTKLNSIASDANIENMRAEFDEKIRELRNEFKKDMDEIKEIIAGLKWKLS